MHIMRDLCNTLCNTLCTHYALVKSSCVRSIALARTDRCGPERMSITPSVKLARLKQRLQCPVAKIGLAAVAWHSVCQTLLRMVAWSERSQRGRLRRSSGTLVERTSTAFRSLMPGCVRGVRAAAFDRFTEQRECRIEQSSENRVRKDWRTHSRRAAHT